MPEPVYAALADAPAEDSAVARSAMRKATWRLIPLIAVGYGIAYIDRINISFAALQMNRDLHFSATIYGLGAGLFFLSYSAFEIPSNLMLHRLGARRWMSRILLTWGVLAMAMALVRTPLEFYVMRLLLGAAEAGFFPGVLYYLTLWFPAHLRARTISRFYVSLPLSTVIMGGLAGALLNMQGRLSLAGWQWLFLAEGLPAVLLSAVFLRLLPDRPADAPWLEPAERDWIESSLAAEHSENTSAHHPGSALRDSRVWLFGLANLVMLCTLYAYSFSAPAILLKFTGFSAAGVGYLVSIFGLLGGAAMIGNAWLSDRSSERYWHIVVPALIEAAAFLVVGFTRNPWVAVPLLALTFLVHNSMQGPLLVLPTAFLTGRGAAAGLAAINMVGMLGGFFGPSFMGLARDLTGSYQTGLAALSLPMLVFAALVLGLKRMARPSATDSSR